MASDVSAAELVGLIGEAATIALVEQFAGTRLTIPLRVRDNHRITRAIGQDAALILSRYYSPDAIIVPLARELRAKHYRAQGLSQSRIALRLGITEKGVWRMLKRLRG